MSLKIFSSFILLSITLLFSQNIKAQRITGEGKVMEQTREVGAFTKISLECSADVEIMQGAASKVTIETYPNIADLIETYVENGTLRIRQKKVDWKHWSWSVNKLKLWITNPTFEKISISGSGNIVSSGKLSASDIDVSVTGSGDMKIADLTATNSKLNITGSGNIIAEGKSEKVEIAVTGSGDANLMNFAAQNVKAHVAGSGNLSCNASDSYNLSVSGSGDIAYKKTNASVNSRSSGSGSIESKN